MWETCRDVGGLREVTLHVGTAGKALHVETPECGTRGGFWRGEQP